MFGPIDGCPAPVVWATQEGTSIEDRFEEVAVGPDGNYILAGVDVCAPVAWSKVATKLRSGGGTKFTAQRNRMENN